MEQVITSEKATLLPDMIRKIVPTGMTAGQMELEYIAETYWLDQAFVKCLMDRYVAAGVVTQNQANLCWQHVFDKRAAQFGKGKGH